MNLKISLITLPFISLCFCGCLVTEAIEVPFTATNFALNTTTKVVTIGSKVVTTTADVGAKVIDARAAKTPPVNVNIN